MEPDAVLIMGWVSRPHGIRGELKVIPETDDPERFRLLETVLIKPADGGYVRYPLESIRFQRGKRGVTVILKLAGIGNRDQAHALRGALVAATPDALPLAEDEYFLSDLIGLDVHTDAGAGIGQIIDILDLPAHPVLVIRRPGGDEVMVPAVPAFMDDIDFDRRRVRIRPIDGLLD